MEGLNAPVEKTISGNRTESIQEADKNVVEIFKAKLTEVLERIGQNPYFRDLEQTI